jgi:arylsulfatase A-like enzyme/Tfp pilus assembly protein PilF
MIKGILNKSRVVDFILLAVFVLSIIWFLFRSETREIRNVLLISIDTCRADHLGCYGHKQNITPNIDALAAEGILFENVVSPCPMTLPSHSSMLTGTIPVYHGVHNNLGYRIAESNITLAEILKNVGFTTGAAVSTLVLDSQFGLDQGFEVYDDRFEQTGKRRNHAERRGGETTERCLDWLAENKDQRFFYFLHYFDPHKPYNPPEPFASRFARNPYAGEIAYTDHCIGQVIAKLRKLDLYDSTLIIVTTDHGEMLGEHGEPEHAYFIYESAVKAALVFRVPGQSREIRIKSPAGLIDIVPTVCSLLGIQPPAAVGGMDLSGCFGGRELSSGRELYCESMQATVYGANALLGIVTDRFKYIQTTRPELYDLVDDPTESNNLVDVQPKRARMLKESLARMIQESLPGDSAGSEAEWDEQTRRRLESLGYVGGDVVADYEFDQTKDDPKDVLSYHLLSAEIAILLSRKRYYRAEQVAEKMIRLRPDSAVGYQKAGRIAGRRGDQARAAGYYQKALRINPDDTKTHNNLGIALASLGKRELAIDHYQKALRISPDDANTHNNLGIALTDLGKPEQAIEHFNKALAIDPDFTNMHYNLGSTFAAMGKFEQAMDHYKKLLTIKPYHADAQNNLGNIYGLLGKPEQAIDHYQKALRLNPNHAGARKNLGDALKNTGKP